VGVEEHWWASAVPGCDPETVSFLDDRMTPEELQAALAAKPPKPCDEVDWRLFGLSLAGLNTIGSLALAAATFAGLRWMAQGDSA
jgi:disulfide bond formation protein DsbB